MTKKTQRTTKNLGINRSKGKELVYKYIEDVLGIKEKVCSRARSTKPSKYNVIHEGPASLPIREFNLQYSYYDDQKKRVIIKKGDGLQIYCIKCERQYRRGRLNKWGAFYGKMTDDELYEYYTKTYGDTASCSKCGLDKNPRDFSISRRMDKGLHNVCSSCTKEYSEAVGDRRIIYSPDGRGSNKLSRKGVCAYCGDSEGIHIDHIRPISKGGTDNDENLQHLCASCNLSKSNSLDRNIKTIHDISDLMICERYHNILHKAQKNNTDINIFLLEISNAVKEFIDYKGNLSDDKLSLFFKKEKSRTNRKYSVSRCVRKFRKYMKNVATVNY